MPKKIPISGPAYIAQKIKSAEHALRKHIPLDQHPAYIADLWQPVRDALLAKGWGQGYMLPEQHRARPYTTKYAVEHARKLGWRILDRESFDARLNRHRDTMFGGDVVALSPDGIVVVQAAGRGERALHHRRFLERGGPAAVAQAKASFVYWEFERGNKTPVNEETWA